MSDTSLEGASPPEDAPVLPEVQAADSSPATDKATESPDKMTGTRLLDEDFRLLSEKAQKRIDHLTWESREKEREADHWRQVAMQITAQKAEPAKETAAGPPTLEQYGYDEAKYQLAVADYVRAEARREALTAIQQLEGHKAQAERAKSWQQREAEFAAKQADYREVAYDPTVPISATMAECIAESDMGPQVAYYLAKNKDEAARIAGLSERAAAREIGRIEARISAKPISPPVSKAPPPPPKIEAADATVSVRPDTADSDSLSDAEWAKKRNAQLARRNKS